MKTLNQLIRLAGPGNSIEIMIGQKRITVAAYDKQAGYKEVVAVEGAATAEAAIDACCNSIELAQCQKTA